MNLEKVVKNQQDNLKYWIFILLLQQRKDKMDNVDAEINRIEKN